MRRFIEWFNSTAPQRECVLPALTRAGIAHLYFTSIHPFEDGNGRIGRAIVSKSFSQSGGYPGLFSISQTIQKNKKKYYSALERGSKSNEITDWLIYFSGLALDSQKDAQKKVDFVIRKGEFYERFKEHFNQRQSKVLARVFREGYEGFKGKMSAKKYISITKTSRATATRDLQDLVKKGALIKTGEGKCYTSLGRGYKRLCSKCSP